MKILITIIAAIMMMNTCNGKKAQPTVRPATQAGRFYDGDAQRLSREVDSLLALHAQDRQYDGVAAIIVPHAGYYFSGNVAAAAYMSLPDDAQYKRIFLLGPSHHEWLDGASVNVGVDYYATPLGNVKVDLETAQELLAADTVFSYRPEAHDREHCLEVQLPFLQRLSQTVDVSDSSSQSVHRHCTECTPALYNVYTGTVQCVHQHCTLQELPLEPHFLGLADLAQIGR